MSARVVHIQVEGHARPVCSTFAWDIDTTTDPAKATCLRCVERHMAREHGRKRAAEGAFGPDARDGVRVPGEVSGE